MWHKSEPGHHCSSPITSRAEKRRCTRTFERRITCHCIADASGDTHKTHIETRPREKTRGGVTLTTKAMKLRIINAYWSRSAAHAGTSRRCACCAASITEKKRTAHALGHFVCCRDDRLVYCRHFGIYFFLGTQLSAIHGAQSSLLLVDMTHSTVGLRMCHYNGLFSHGTIHSRVHGRLIWTMYIHMWFDNIEHLSTTSGHQFRLYSQTLWFPLVIHIRSFSAYTVTRLSETGAIYVDINFAIHADILYKENRLPPT